MLLSGIWNNLSPRYNIRLIHSALLHTHTYILHKNSLPYKIPTPLCNSLYSPDSSYIVPPAHPVNIPLGDIKRRNRYAQYVYAYNTCIL